MSGEWRKILDVSIPEMAIPWTRTRGKGKLRYTPQKMKNWQELVKLQVEDELNLTDVKFDRHGYFRLQVTLYIPRIWWTRCGDGDNYEKCIVDALRKLVWWDDKIKYLGPRQFLPVMVAEQEDAATKVEVWTWDE